MPSTRTAGARSENLHSTCLRMYDEAGRDSSKAIELVVAQLRKRPALHEEAWREAAAAIIGAISRSDRQRVLRGEDIGSVQIVEEAANDPLPSTVVPFVEQSAASKAASNARARRFGAVLTGLYLTKFKDGQGGEVLLGQAKPEELAPAIAHYLGQGATMVRTGRWLSAIASAAKPGVPIHKSLSLKRIEELQRKALASEV